MADAIKIKESEEHNWTQIKFEKGTVDRLIEFMRDFEDLVEQGIARGDAGFSLSCRTGCAVEEGGEAGAPAFIMEMDGKKYGFVSDEARFLADAIEQSCNKFGDDVSGELLCLRNALIESAAAADEKFSKIE